MLAGKTAISKAITAHAPNCLVLENNSSNAHTTSVTPLKKTSSLCHGSQGGIICK